MPYNRQNEKKWLIDLSESVKQISKDAGKIILTHYYTDFSKTIQTKNDDSPVTIADKEANDFIVSRLKKVTPEIPVIAEESAISCYIERKKWVFFWLVDPLDGTKEFINRNGEFTVNIALIKKNKPILACVYSPLSKEIFWAIEKMGAYKETDMEIARLIANPIDLNSESLKIVISRSHSDNETLNYLQNFNNPIIVRKGSSLKFISVASGEADLYFRTNPVMEWDSAASHIIINESGAELRNIKNGNNIFYNKRDLKIPGFIVYRKFNTTQVLVSQLTPASPLSGEEKFNK
jgi:3'(2'), 5'-bisphosphate nucleotidase